MDGIKDDQEAADAADAVDAEKDRVAKEEKIIADAKAAKAISDANDLQALKDRIKVLEHEAKKHKADAAEAAQAYSDLKATAGEL